MSPAPYGIVPTGFAVKTLADVKLDLENGLRARYGSAFDTSPQSVAGQWVGVMSEALAACWDTAQAVYSAFDPDEASGVALDRLAALTGTRRRDPTRSTAVVTLTGTGGTVIPAGRIFSVGGTLAQFRTVADVTLPGPAGAPGQTTTVDVESVDLGPVEARAGTLTGIVTSVAGLAAVTNAEDAKLGLALETDAELRARRTLELHASGGASAEAIRARISQLAGVVAVQVFENPTPTTDAEGMPPHSLEVLVDGGMPADIGAALLDVKPLGIEAHGLETVTVSDAAGREHVLRFTRPEAVDVYVRLDVIADSLKFPSDGAAQVRQALLDFAEVSLVIGRDVTAAALIAQAFKVPGVLDVAVYIGLAVDPATSATVEINRREWADLDSARIAVNVAYGVP
jgi:uncharacterized phage protein gp47/JayE